MYSLPKTGIGAITVGGVAIYYPWVAAGVAVILVGLGIALRITGRRRKLTK